MKNHSESTTIPRSTPAAARYRATGFFQSVNALAQLPPDRGWEVAFAGRSNAGKSSALNALTGQRQLARVSKTPGRTQLLNFFLIAPERYLVDLPGYGYAQVPESLRQHWRLLLERYLSQRIALRGLMLLMDSRHPLTALDQRLLDSCFQRQLPVHVLLTKADKLSRGAGQTALQQVQQRLKSYAPYSSAQLFSALTGLGIAEAHAQLDAWLGYSVG